MENNIDYKKLYEEKEAELKRTKKEIQELKDAKSKKIKKYYDEVQGQIKVINNLKVEIKNLEDTIIEKDKVIYEKELKIKELTTIEQNFKKIISNNKVLRKKLKNQRSEIDNLTKKNTKIKITDDTQIDISKVNKREANLLKEISGLKNSNNNLQQAIDKLLLEKDMLVNSKKISNMISNTIALLSKELNINNVIQYKNIIALADKVNLLLEKKTNYEFVNKDIITNEEISIDIESNILWGYTFEEDNEIKFIDINGLYYPIAHWSDNSIKVDMPVKAILTNNSTVIIKKIYNECNHGVFIDKNDTKKSHKQKLTQTLTDTQEKILPIGNYKVLVITGRNSKHYKEYLEQYGLSVSVFDPYEENLNLLSDKVEMQDIVLVMKNAIPHTVTDILNKEDSKIQMMGRDNKKYLIARIKYYLANKDDSTQLSIKYD